METLLPNNHASAVQEVIRINLKTLGDKLIGMINEVVTDPGLATTRTFDNVTEHDWIEFHLDPHAMLGYDGGYRIPAIVLKYIKAYYEDFGWEVAINYSSCSIKLTTEGLRVDLLEESPNESV